MTYPQDVRSSIGLFGLIWCPWAQDGLTIHTPRGKKIRVTEYADGRVRFRLEGAAPMMVQECYLTGRGNHVIVTLVPPGWNKPAKADAPASTEEEKTESAP